MRDEILPSRETVSRKKLSKPAHRCTTQIIDPRLRDPPNDCTTGKLLPNAALARFLSHTAFNFF